MVNVAFLPADQKRCCLDIQRLISTLPESLTTTATSPLVIQQAITPTTEALFWLPNIAQGNTAGELSTILNSPFGTNIRFVQLPMTGVDHFLPLIRSSEGRGILWGCAKGCYADPVAEHALALSLTLLRGLNRNPPLGAREGDTLRRKNVLIVGDGSIASELSRLLQPFDCSVSILNSTTSREAWLLALPRGEIVILACPLTPATQGLFNEEAFNAMQNDAILINVARGEVVDTSALVEALQEGKIRAAGLDVISYTLGGKGIEVEKEVQMLVEEGKLLVTPHSAIPAKLIPQLLGQRIKDNLERLVRAGDGDGNAAFLGLVDPQKGY